MARKATKAAAILELLNKGVPSGKIVKRLKVAPSYVWKLKKEMAHAQEEVGEYKPVPLRKKGLPEAVEAILDTRHNNYGSFTDGAEVIRALKHEIYIRGAYGKLAADQAEALDMIFHKIGRIVNGNADHVDSWTDIAGYAKLVADRLQGVVR